LTGFAAWVLGEVEAIVDVGVLVLGGVAVLLEVVDVVEAVEELEPCEVLVSGEGDTIDTVEVGAVVVEDEVVVVEEDPDDGGAGLDLSWGTALAKGLRAMRASTTFVGSAGLSLAVVAVVPVPAPDTGVADGGAGTVGVVRADALLSRNTGTAATATTRSATSIHSLRSTRSRRSAFISILRSCRLETPAGRWWR
jgi:hypothetical protein